MLASIRHPSSFRALCLFVARAGGHRHDPVDTLDVLIEHGRDRDALHDGFLQMFIRAPGQLLELTLDAVTLVDASVHRAQKRQNPHFSIDDRLKDMTTPTLLISGGSDTVVPPDRQHDMAKKLPRSKAVVVSTEGHMMAVESPQNTAREILVFLGHDRPPLASAAQED